MNIVLAGTGNVATVLGRLLRKAGHRIPLVTGRNPDHTRNLAVELGAEPGAFGDVAEGGADVCIIAVKDDALPAVCRSIKNGNMLAIHTAGGAPMGILASVSRNYGVLYPLQSIRKEVFPVPDIPFLIDANNDANRKIIRDIAGSISTLVRDAGDRERNIFHIAAVSANNFSNYLYRLVHEFCIRENVDFKFLLPLLSETVTRLHKYSPASVQTGPAVRGDEETIKKHRAALEAHPALLRMYDIFTTEIMNAVSPAAN